MIAPTTSNGHVHTPHNRVFAPSTDGDNGKSGPSRNGDNGKSDPSANGSIGYKPGYPTNPFARKIAEFRIAFIETIAKQDIVDIRDKLLALAKDGNVSAAKVLLAYALGKPASVANPDTLDLEEWKLHEQQPLVQELQQEVPSRCPTELACVMARAYSVVNTSLFKSQAKQMLTKSVRQAVKTAGRKK